MTAAEPEDRANRLGRIVDRLGSQRAGGERVLRFEGESSEGTALVESRDRQLRLWIPPARRSALETMLERTLEMLSSCPCEDGCPSCVHSPQCGNANRTLNKQLAIRLLKQLLEIPVQ